MSAGKGDRNRVTDWRQYENNYANIRGFYTQRVKGVDNRKRVQPSDVCEGPGSRSDDCTELEQGDLENPEVNETNVDRRSRTQTEGA